MPFTIVVASGKGGVGKSTTAVALGRTLSRKGKKVLLIDCDAGLSSLDVMLKTRGSTVFGWYDAFMGNCTPDETLTKISDCLFLMSAPTVHISGEDESIVQKVTDGLTDEFDIIIRDAPAGIGKGLNRAAYGADLALIVATGDPVSVKDSAAVADIIRGQGIKNVRLIINRYDIKAAKKGKYLTVDEIIDSSFVRLIGIVPEDKNIMYSTVKDISEKKFKSLSAFERISQRIEGKKVDLTLSLLK